MKYKLVCIDLDGTLLNSKHYISEFNKQIIKKVRAKGVAIAIVTGRRYKSAVHYAKELELHAPIICFNGGMVADTKSESIIHTASLDRNYANKILKAFVKTGAPVFAYAPTFDNPDVYCYYDQKSVMRSETTDHPDITDYIETEQEAIHLKTNLGDPLSFDPLRLMTFGWNSDVDNCDFYKDQLGNEDIIWLRTIGPRNTSYLEILPKQARKSFGLQWLAKHYGILQEQVLAIGDNLNDLDMLEWAGCGVAMGNAFPEVKKVADISTCSCDEDGVGKILEELLLQ